MKELFLSRGSDQWRGKKGGIRVHSDNSTKHAAANSWMLYLNPIACNKHHCKTQGGVCFFGYC